MGHPIAKVFPSGLLPKEVEEALGVRNRGEVVRFDVIRRRRDGTSIQVEAQAVALGDELGGVITYASVGRNSAEHDSLQEQLRESQKMEAVGRLAGGVAHDFNNLLSVIGGYTQMVYLNTPAGDPAREQLGEVLKAAERAGDLTRQLLAFDRKQVVQPYVLDMTDTLKEMQNFLPRLIGEDVELEFRPDPEPGRLRMDPGQIEQIVMNLVAERAGRHA